LPIVVWVGALMAVSSYIRREGSVEVPHRVVVHLPKEVIGVKPAHGGRTLPLAVERADAVM
jgi:hypothetical protein